jgi:superfamily II DNA/RNA helicase
MTDFQAKICEKFNINSLTDNQSKSITAIIDRKYVFVGTKMGSGKSLTYEAMPVVFPQLVVAATNQNALCKKHVL